MGKHYIYLAIDMEKDAAQDRTGPASPGRVVGSLHTETNTSGNFESDKFRSRELGRHSRKTQTIFV
eukprot:2841270-Pyramimonas_sp.AAC.1